MTFETIGRFAVRFCNPGRVDEQPGGRNPEVRHAPSCLSIVRNLVFKQPGPEQFEAVANPEAKSSGSSSRLPGALPVLPAITVPGWDAPLPTASEMLFGSLKSWYENEVKALVSDDARRSSNQFNDLSGLLHNEKTMLFKDAASASTAEDRRIQMKAAVRQSDWINSKSGHTANVVSVAKQFLADEKVLAALGTDASPQQIENAAQWLTLADFDIPVKILAADRRLTADEQEQHVHPRMRNSASIVRKLELADEPVARLIEQTRYAQNAGQRPRGSQFLDLVDRLCAMGAKEKFRDKQGKVLVDKVLGFIQQDLQREGAVADDAVWGSVRACAMRGDLDNALMYKRSGAYAWH